MTPRKGKRAILAIVSVAAVMTATATSAQDAYRPFPGHRAVTIHRHHHWMWRGPFPPGAVASPLDVPLDDNGLYFRTPFQIVAAGDYEEIVRIPPYQGPDGTYETHADLTQAINGTPCGEECTARSLLRWGLVPVE